MDYNTLSSCGTRNRTRLPLSILLEKPEMDFAVLDQKIMPQKAYEHPTIERLATAMKFGVDSSTSLSELPFPDGTADAAFFKLAQEQKERISMLPPVSRYSHSSINDFIAEAARQQTENSPSMPTVNTMAPDYAVNFVFPGNLALENGTCDFFPAGRDLEDSFDSTTSTYVIQKDFNDHFDDAYVSDDDVRNWTLDEESNKDLVDNTARVASDAHVLATDLGNQLSDDFDGEHQQGISFEAASDTQISTSDLDKLMSDEAASNYFDNSLMSLEDVTFQSNAFSCFLNHDVLWDPLKFDVSANTSPHQISTSLSSRLSSEETNEQRGFENLLCDEISLENSKSDPPESPGHVSKPSADYSNGPYITDSNLAIPVIKLENSTSPKDGLFNRRTVEQHRHENDLKVPAGHVQKGSASFRYKPLKEASKTQDVEDSFIKIRSGYQSEESDFHMPQSIIFDQGPANSEMSLDRTAEKQDINTAPHNLPRIVGASYPVGSYGLSFDKKIFKLLARDKFFNPHPVLIAHDSAKHGQPFLDQVLRNSEDEQRFTSDGTSAQFEKPYQVPAHNEIPLDPSSEDFGDFGRMQKVCPAPTHSSSEHLQAPRSGIFAESDPALFDHFMSKLAAKPMTSTTQAAEQASDQKPASNMKRTKKHSLTQRKIPKAINHNLKDNKYGKTMRNKSSGHFHMSSEQELNADAGAKLGKRKRNKPEPTYTLSGPTIVRSFNGLTITSYQCSDGIIRILSGKLLKEARERTLAKVRNANE